MVKKLIATALTALILSSCGFFGSSVFPVAESVDLGWFIHSGNLERFYILDNGAEELLILAKEDNGNKHVLILDTALNMRGYMSPDSTDVPIATDGVGFIDHGGNFVIGQTRLGPMGTAGYDDISTIPLPFMGANAAIIPYTGADGIDHYIRIDYNGDVDVYTDAWAPEFMMSIGASNFMIIPQSDTGLGDVKFGLQTGQVYSFTKEALYNHANNNPMIDINATTPELTIVNTDLTPWVTRCSKGYFLSTFSRTYLLYDYAGNEIERIEDKGNNKGEVVTIDYDCRFYYVVDWDESVIRKERVPF